MYDDIINLDRPKSSHKKMSRLDRAAQFSSFQALTGYSDMINESKRLTSAKIELSEDEILILNNKLNYLLKNNLENNEVTITYFVKDKTKDGGKYLEYTGLFKKIDYINQLITVNNKKISLDDIINIQGEMFKEE